MVSVALSEVVFIGGGSRRLSTDNSIADIRSDALASIHTKRL